MHPDAEQALKAWHADVRRAHWVSPVDVTNEYANARFVGNNRIVFNIRGNHYRLIVLVKFDFELVLIRFVGTHNEYDRVDATTV